MSDEHFTVESIGHVEADEGGFALVIAVDRAGIAEELRAAGAYLVVDDLACLVERAEETSPEVDRNSRDGGAFAIDADLQAIAEAAMHLCPAHP